MRPPIEELADLEAVLAVTHRDAHGVAIVRRASARIAELEHQLEIRKAAVEAQFGLIARVKEMAKALRMAHEVLSGHAMSKQELIDTLQAIKNCGL